MQDRASNDNILLANRAQIEILDTPPLPAVDASWNEIFFSAHPFSRLLPSSGRTATGFARVSLLVYHLLSLHRTGQTKSQIEV